MANQATVVVRVGLAAAVVVGTAARFVTGSPMWLDEALSVNIAALDLADIPEALRRDGHPPLYYWLLHLWMAVAGDSDIATRAFSGVLGLAALPLAWIAGRRAGGPAVGAWAVVVLALNPFAVRYATEARMYTLVMLLVLAGYLLLTDALARPSPARLGALAVVASALAWTHYWSFFLLAVVGALVVGVAWRRPGPERSAAMRVAGALVAGAVLFLPWLPSMLDQLEATGTPWAEPSRPTQVLAVTLVDLAGGGFAEAQLLAMVVVALLAVGLCGRRAASGEGVLLRWPPAPALRWEMGVAGGALGLGAATSYLLGTGFASRHASVVVPLLLLVVARGAALLPAGWLRVGLVAPLVVFSLVGVVANVVQDRTQLADLAMSIAAEAAPGDMVVVCPDQLGPALERALRQAEAMRAVPLVPYPAGGDPRFVDWRHYQARNDAADPVAFADEIHARAGGGRVWLVWSGTYRTFEGDCEAVAARLGQLRPGAALAEAGEQFEAANLFRYGPP